MKFELGPSPVAMSTQMGDQLREENRVLKAELNHVEDLLATCRAERDEIGVRYAAVSERVRSVDTVVEILARLCALRCRREYLEPC